jgi:hypothetical protein
MLLCTGTLEIMVLALSRKDYVPSVFIFIVADWVCVNIPTSI